LVIAASRTTNPRSRGTLAATSAALKASNPPMASPRPADHTVVRVERKYTSRLSPTIGAIASAGVTIIPLAHPARPPHTHTTRISARPVTGAAIADRSRIGTDRRVGVRCCRSSTGKPPHIIVADARDRRAPSRGPRTAREHR
jgi:hypothetical protein